MVLHKMLKVESYCHLKTRSSHFNSESVRTWERVSVCHKKSICSDEGLTLETSAFLSLYGGQFTLSTPLINQIFVRGTELTSVQPRPRRFFAYRGAFCHVIRLNGAFFFRRFFSGMCLLTCLFSGNFILNSCLKKTKTFHRVLRDKML